MYNKGQIKHKPVWAGRRLSQKMNKQNLFCLQWKVKKQRKQIRLFVFWENLQFAKTAFYFIWPLLTFSPVRLSPHLYKSGPNWNETQVVENSKPPSYRPVYWRFRLIKKIKLNHGVIQNSRIFRLCRSGVYWVYVSVTLTNM